MMLGTIITRWKWGFAVGLLALSFGAGALFFNGQAQAGIQIAAPYSGSYSLTDLGSIPGVPTRYGGMTFKNDNPNQIIIGGNANAANGELYAVTVTRGAGNHITGYSGSATSFANAPNNDGGVAYGPGDVLFLARWPNTEVGEVKPGSSTVAKVVDMAALGMTGSPGGLNFVPTGFPGAGQMKIVSYDDGRWYTAAYSAGASGTYNITSVTQNTTLGDVVGPEGFTYVPPGSALFPANTMLQAEYSNGSIGAYQLDSGGNPKIATRTDFITNLSGAEGAVIDPVTGDFLFSTFGGGDRLIVVKGGFVPPPTATPSTPPSASPTASPTATQSGLPTATPTHSPTPTPTGTPSGNLIQGNVNCDPHVDEADFDLTLKFAAGLNDGTTPGSCPDLGESEITSGHPWGDVTCNGFVDALDALYELAYKAGTPLTTPGQCFAVGSLIT